MNGDEPMAQYMIKTKLLESPRWLENLTPQTNFWGKRRPLTLGET